MSASGDPSFNTVAQSAHFFSALSVALLCQHFRLPTLWWMIAGVIVAAAKEFYYDYHFESAPVCGSSLEDFAFYAAGLAVGFGVWHL